MQFVDKTKLFVISGNGGDGIISWRREKYLEFGGPDGGNGGNGGNVYIKGDRGLYSLYDLKLNPHQKAKHGKPGSKRKRSGSNGEDLTIKVPLGTVVRDIETERVIVEVLDENPVLLLAGGKGGFGNAHFKSSTRQAPKIATSGKKGIMLTIILDLMTIADVGLVGFPNAGKSTFISSVSNAKPLIADYPFTTINPHLGVIKRPDFNSFVIADIPGIISGASKGLGLGTKFLQHIIRTKILAFLIDCSINTDVDPLSCYQELNNELISHSADFKNRPRLILLTKIDQLSKELDIQKIEHYCQENNLPLFKISAKERLGLEEVLAKLEQLIAAQASAKNAAANKNPNPINS